MKDILKVFLAILLLIGVVYFIVQAAWLAWGYVCVSAFGFPMLTKMQMFVLMLLINLLSPFHYSRGSK